MMDTKTSPLGFRPYAPSDAGHVHQRGRRSPWGELPRRRRWARPGVECGRRGLSTGARGGLADEEVADVAGKVEERPTPSGWASRSRARRSSQRSGLDRVSANCILPPAWSTRSLRTAPVSEPTRTETQHGPRAFSTRATVAGGAVAEDVIVVADQQRCPAAQRLPRPQARAEQDREQHRSPEHDRRRRRQASAPVSHRAR